MNQEELLARARAEPAESIKRDLYVIALVAQVLGKRVVLIGGAASNLHTGDYVPTDLDLVGHAGKAERKRLVAAGFVDPGVGGRHLSLDLGDEEVLVEFPTSRLDGKRPTERITLDENVEVEVISLDDLVMDRLIQCTAQGPVEFDQALALAVAAYLRIDWQWIEEQVELEEKNVPGLIEAHARVRKAAKRAMR